MRHACERANLLSSVRTLNDVDVNVICKNGNAGCAIGKGGGASSLDNRNQFCKDRMSCVAGETDMPVGAGERSLR